MALSVEQVEKLRAAGFSDEDIIAYDKEQDAAPAAPAPVDPAAQTATNGELPSYDLNVEPPETTKPPETTYSEDFMALLPSATDAAKFIVENPLTAATSAAGGAAIISALPGVRNVPPFKQINETRQNIMARVAPSAAERALNTQGKELANQKMAIEIEERRFKLDEQKNAAQRRTFNALSQEYGPAQQRVATQAQPVPDKPVVFRQPPGVTPGAGGQVPVQGPPSANNYMQRMNNLAEQYRGVNPVVNPPAQPQPVQQVPTYRGSSGMTYKPIQGGGGMRGGGGGGGGGGGLMQDPLNRRFRPLQY